MRMIIPRCRRGPHTYPQCNEGRGRADNFFRVGKFAGRHPGHGGCVSDRPRHLDPNAPGSFGSGRREINWDGVPDAFAAPNNLPVDFFNVNSPRGVVFTTAGTGFQVSANAVNPTNTPVLFGNINPTYPSLFQTFSPQKLFTALSSNLLDVDFFVPGSTTPALTRGFGSLIGPRSG